MTAKKTAPDWSVVRLAYIHSSKSMADVAREFGVSEDAVRKRNEREGWVRLRHEAAQIVTNEAARRIEAARADELAKQNESDLKLARALRAQITMAINAVTLNPTQPLAPLQVRQLAGALAETQKVARLALGATTDNTGISSPAGGPVESANVPVEEYRDALRDVLREFTAPGSLGD